MLEPCSRTTLPGDISVYERNTTWQISHFKDYLYILPTLHQVINVTLLKELLRNFPTKHLTVFL